MPSKPGRKLVITPVGFWSRLLWPLVRYRVGYAAVKPGAFTNVEATVYTPGVVFGPFDISTDLRAP